MNTMTTVASDASTRIPISLRLPANVIDVVNEYAQEHRVSKTDAFLHFLQTGMAVENSPTQEQHYEEFMSQLAQIKSLLLQDNNAHADTREAICRDVSVISAEYPAIKRAYLFGSFARNDYTRESDIDLRIELDESISFNLHDLARFSKQVERLTGRNTDVISAKQIKNPKLAESIEKEKVLIYERKK